MPHIPRARYALAAIALLCICIGRALAQSTVTIGSAAIVLPAPPSLVALRNTSSPYYRFGASIQAQSKNELLASYLLPADAKTADAGHMPSAKHWAIAYSLGRLSDKPISARDFSSQIVPNVENQFGRVLSSADVHARVQSGVDTSSRQLQSDLAIDEPITLKLGQIRPFGVYDRSDSFVVYGAGSRVRGSVGTYETEMPIVLVGGFLRVRDRLFCIAVYREYRTAADIDATKRDATAWVHSIIAANR